MDKFKNLAGYIVAVIIVLAAAYYTGFLEGFTPQDFQNAYNKISSNVASSTNNTRKYINKSSGNDNVKNFGKYHPNTIEEGVLLGSSTTGAWSNIFKSTKKTVFYIYNDNNDNFYSEISSYITKNKIDRYYNVIALEKRSYSNYSVGNSSYAKICNSLEECKQQRDRAANYSKLANFMENCGKTICVINPNLKQYIRLNKRDVNEAKQLLEGVKLWWFYERKSI